MIRKFAKILPYCIVMWFAKKFGASLLSNDAFMNDELVGWRIDKGEWIVWNKNNYDRMREDERKDEEKKLHKKFRNIMGKVSTNYDLDQELRKHYENVIRKEKEEG